MYPYTSYTHTLTYLFDGLCDRTVLPPCLDQPGRHVSSRPHRVDHIRSGTYECIEYEEGCIGSVRSV